MNDSGIIIYVNNTIKLSSIITAPDKSLGLHVDCGELIFRIHVDYSLNYEFSEYNLKLAKYVFEL